MSGLKRERTIERFFAAAWGSFFVLLPVTSMPLIVRLVGSDVVAAPSGLILAVLSAGWILPRWARGTLRFAPSADALFFFVLFAVAATFLRFLIPLPETAAPAYKDAPPFRQALSASLTLAVGFGFFLGAATFCRSRERQRWALRLINWSGAAILAWTLLQAFFWYTRQGYPYWMRQVQGFFSVGTLFRQRFVGFTLEPSWLAHQLNLLYLPWWLAAATRGTTAHERRKGRLTVETVLLALGTLVLYLTLSRVGLLAFALVLASAFVRWLTKRKRFGRIWLALPALPLLAFALLWTLTKLDYRMRDLFSLQLSGRADPVFYVAEKLSLASRFVYWDAGWRVFCDAPLFGVGLGQSGFYLPDALSPAALRLVEVRDLIFRSETLLNIKSFWIRVLAETGAVGFSLFMSWIAVSFAQARQLTARASAFQRAIGSMAIFSLTAFTVEGFSVDTFALPYLWICVGLSAAAWLEPDDAGAVEV